MPTGRDEKWIHHTSSLSGSENAPENYGEKRNAIPMSEQPARKCDELHASICSSAIVPDFIPVNHQKVEPLGNCYQSFA